LLVVIGGCAATGPITTEAGRSIDPPSCLFGIRGRLLEVADKRRYPDQANIGFTQTGITNKSTSLLASPPPAELLRDSLGRLLETCATYGDSTPTPLAFHINLSTFQVTETTVWSKETMKAEVVYTVEDSEFKRPPQGILIPICCSNPGPISNT